MTKSVISAHILALVSMRKNIFKHKYIPNRIDYKNNTALLYFILGRAFKIFPVYLRMALIFTDFQECIWSRPTSCWKICEYQTHPVQYYFGINSIGYLFMFKNIFSHRCCDIGQNVLVKMSR